MLDWKHFYFKVYRNPSIMETWGTNLEKKLE